MVSKTEEQADKTHNLVFDFEPNSISFRSPGGELPYEATLRRIQPRR